jgi:predicted porin
METFFGDYSMKKTQIALAALALVASTAALADGVTVYGAIDVGLSSTNNGNTTTRAFNGAGIESPSYIGFRGSEDLGNGMKASFNLEAGLNSGLGTLGNGSGSNNTAATYANGGAVTTSIFGRALNVGLEGDFGSVKAGVVMDPAFLAALGVDPRGMGNGNGTLLSSWGFQSGAITPNTFSGIFNANSVLYTSPNMNGLQVSGSYGMGGTSGSRQDGTQAIGVTYAAGNLNFAGWSNTIYSDTANAKLYTNSGIGAGLAISETLSVKGFINKVQTYSTANVVTAERNTVGIGGTYALQDNLKLTVAYYTKDNNMVANSDNTMTVTNLTYGLSPRTSAYVTYVMENAKSETGSFAGANKNGSKAAVGILHSF